MTQHTPELLVCVYYRLAADDAHRVISAVREFQRTLRPGGGPIEAQVLLRFDLPLPASPPDALSAPLPSPEPPPGAERRVDLDPDATVMETYRLPLPAVTGADAETAMRAFLATLESAAAPHAGLLRGTRHVELFVPCAS